MGYNKESLVEKGTGERYVQPRVSVVYRILPWPVRNLNMGDTRTDIGNRERIRSNASAFYHR